MRVADLLSPDRIDPSLVVEDKASALDAMANLLARGTEGVGPSEIARVLREREQLASTGVGDEVAMPHGKIAGLKQLVAAMALAPQGVDFDSIDRQPVKIFVAILAPERAAGDHLRALVVCSKLLRDASVRARLIASGSAEEIFEIVRRESSPSG